VYFIEFQCLEHLCLWVHLKPCCVLEVSGNYRCAPVRSAGFNVLLVPEIVEISINARNLHVCRTLISAAKNNLQNRQFHRP
jgi:hypothetical protein